jgi:hypothetical protein
MGSLDHSPVVASSQNLLGLSVVAPSYNMAEVILVND